MERDNTEKLVSELNRAIERLRSEARSEKFRKGLDLFQRGIRKNYGSVKHYLSSICERRQDYILFEIKLFFPYPAEKSPDYALRTEENYIAIDLSGSRRLEKILQKGSLDWSCLVDPVWIQVCMALPRNSCPKSNE